MSTDFACAHVDNRGDLCHGYTVGDTVIDLVCWLRVRKHITQVYISVTFIIFRVLSPAVFCIGPMMHVFRAVLWFTALKSTAAHLNPSFHTFVWDGRFIFKTAECWMCYLIISEQHIGHQKCPSPPKLLCLSLSQLPIVFDRFLSPFSLMFVHSGW